MTTFIPLRFLHPGLSASRKNKPEAAPKPAPLHRSYSDPMMSLPPMNSDWADLHKPEQPWARPAPLAPGDDHAGRTQDMVLVSTLLLEHKITNLEERLKTAMGPWALYGLRYSTLVGLGTATITKIALVVLAGILPVSPVASLAIFLGVVVGSIAVGLLVQTVARRKFVVSGQSDAFLAEIASHQKQLLGQERLSGMEVKSLRRLQILEADIHGGVRHSLWSIFYGITGFDPALTRMMRNASDAHVAQPKKASSPLRRTFAWVKRPTLRRYSVS